MSENDKDVTMPPPRCKQYAIGYFTIIIPPSAYISCPIKKENVRVRSVRFLQLYSLREHLSHVLGIIIPSISHVIQSIVNVYHRRWSICT